MEHHQVVEPPGFLYLTGRIILLLVGNTHATGTDLSNRAARTICPLRACCKRRRRHLPIRFGSAWLVSVSVSWSTTQRIVETSGIRYAFHSPSCIGGDRVTPLKAHLKALMKIIAICTLRQRSFLVSHTLVSVTITCWRDSIILSCQQATHLKSACFFRCCPSHLAAPCRLCSLPCSSRFLGHT